MTNPLLDKIIFWKKSVNNYFDSDEETAIIKAIQEAEKNNRGEVRVHIEFRCPLSSSLERAKELFYSQGIDETAADTGVLLYAAVKDRKAAVFSGQGIHGAAGEEFWKGAINYVSDGFLNNNAVDGFVKALKKIGDLLRKEVPGEDIDGNELPDGITQDIEIEKKNVKDKILSGSQFIKLYLISILCLLLFSIFAYIEYSNIKSAYLQVEKNRSQVQNIMTRQEAVIERYKGEKLTPQQDAELAGAENRLRVERRRYDESTMIYNKIAGDFPGNIWSSILKLPGKVPLSDEVISW